MAWVKIAAVAKPNDFNPKPLQVIPEEVWEKNERFKEQNRIRYHEEMEATREFCYANGLEYLFRPKRKSRTKIKRRS